MSTISGQLPAHAVMPGGRVLDEVRRLVVTALVAGVGYSFFTSAGQGRCVGGVDADGGFVDRYGQQTDAVPACIDLTLRPSPVVFLVLAAIVAWVVTRVVRRATDEDAALRIIGRAGPAVIVAAIVSVVLSQVVFSAIPLEGWDGTGTPVVPGWLSVDVVISPMSTG